MIRMLTCFLAATLGAVATAAFGETPGQRAYADLVEYVDVIRFSPAFDECLDATKAHQCVRGPRSGTGLGLAVHDWMRDELVAILGAANVSRQTLGFARFVPQDYSLSVETEGEPFHPAVYPWYYKGVTPPEGVTAPLADVGGGTAAEYALAGNVSGKIVVLHTPLALNAGPIAYTQGGFQRALDGGAVGMVIAPQAPGNELVAFNADARAGMGPLPTVVVGKVDGARLAELDGRLATLLVVATIDSGAEVTNEIG
ncbi:MAG: PA domain-containing protein, partial [Candidatus Binatia bacterium]